MGQRGVTFERAKQEVINRCLETLKRLLHSHNDSHLPDELNLKMQGIWRYNGMIGETQVRIVIPKPVSYITQGQLIGGIEGHNVVVFNDGNDHFRAVLDGAPRDWLSQKFVEEGLKIPVQKKQTGAQAGRPSEAVIRAVWRHLADRYNKGDMTVIYNEATN